MPPPNSLDPVHWRAQILLSCRQSLEFVSSIEQSDACGKAARALNDSLAQTVKTVMAIGAGRTGEPEPADLELCAQLDVIAAEARELF
jgi:hypothetical protein